MRSPGHCVGENSTRREDFEGPVKASREWRARNKAKGRQRQRQKQKQKEGEGATEKRTEQRRKSGRERERGLAGLEHTGRAVAGRRAAQSQSHPSSHRHTGQRQRPRRKNRKSSAIEIMLGAKCTATSPLPRSSSLARTRWICTPDRLSQDGCAIALFLFRTSLSSIHGLLDALFSSFLTLT
jgi:hypothetical protein